MALSKAPYQVAGRLGPLILKETSNHFTSTTVARNSEGMREQQDLMRTSSPTKIDAFDLVLVKGSDEIVVHHSESVKKYQSYFDSGYVLHVRKRG